jgi:hypothetical protein
MLELLIMEEEGWIENIDYPGTPDAEEVKDRKNRVECFKAEIKDLANYTRRS